MTDVRKSLFVNTFFDIPVIKTYKVHNDISICMITYDYIYTKKGTGKGTEGSLLQTNIMLHASCPAYLQR